MNDAVFRTISSIFLSAFYGAAIYGIHKKAFIAWKIGWGVLAAGILSFWISALSATSKIPKSDYPQVAAASAVIGGAAVGVYWGYWWYKQKSYFVNSARANHAAK